MPDQDPIALWLPFSRCYQLILFQTVSSIGVIRSCLWINPTKNWRKKFAEVCSNIFHLIHFKILKYVKRNRFITTNSFRNHAVSPKLAYFICSRIKESRGWNQTRRISSALTIVADSWKTVSTRERERENRRPCSKYIVAMLKFRLQLSSSFPLSHKIAPQIRLSFHTRISTPICHACIEATYLYTSLRIVIMERTRSTTKTTVPGMIDFSKGQLVSTRH